MSVSAFPANKLIKFVRAVADEVKDLEGASFELRLTGKWFANHQGDVELEASVSVPAAVVGQAGGGFSRESARTGGGEFSLRIWRNA